MDIRHLSFFIVVAEERSISRAAALLNLTQSSLTRHIQALEEKVGVPLLERMSWGVGLTDAGRLLLEHARDIKAHVELAARQARQIAADRLGRIDIGVHGTAMLRVVPGVLGRFAVRHPRVELMLQSEPKTLLLEALHERRILIFFDRNLWETADIAVEEVEREPPMLAVHEADPLAKLDRIHTSALSGGIFVEVDGKSLARLALMCQQHGFTPHVRHRARDLITAVLMVSGGHGATLVPASMAELRVPHVVYRPLASEGDLAMPTHCAYRRGETHPMLLELLRCVREYREAQESGAGPR